MSTSNNNSTIVYSVDASGFEAGVNKIKAGSAAINVAQTQMAERAALVDAAMKEAASNGFDLNARAANKLAAEYQRLSSTIGKTQADILAQRAAYTGVTSTFASMQSQIAAASQETHGFSLATGGARRELAVLAHEAATGNWSRFAGSLGVLGERTGAISLLFSGLGAASVAAAAATAGVVYEIVKGAEAFNALTLAASSTNDYIGLTSGQLKDMAVALAGTNGSVTAASQTLATLVGSGHIAGDTLLSAGKAAQVFAAQTGMSADKAAEAMIAFAEDPAKAMDTLQGKYHEFTQAQVDVIEGFIKQGDAASAVAAGFADIAAKSKTMSTSVLADMGLIRGSWEGWKQNIQEASNWLGNIGKATTQAEQYAAAVQAQAKAQENFNQAAAMPFGNTASAKEALDNANAQLAVQQKLQAAAVTKAASDKASAAAGTGALNSAKYQASNKYANPQDKRDFDITGENAAFAEATKGLDKDSADYQKDLKQHLDAIAQINATYAKKSQGPSNNDAINAQIKALDAQTDSLKSIYKQQNDAAEARYKTGTIDQQTFLAEQLQAQEKELAGEARVAQEQAELAKGKKQTEAYQEYLKKVKDIQNQMVDAASKASTGIIEANEQQADAIKKFADGQNSNTANQQQGFDNSNATQFMTQELAAQFNARVALLNAYNKTIEQLTSEHDSRQISQGVYDSNKASADAAYAQQNEDLTQQQAKQLAIKNDYYAQVQLAATKSLGDTQTNAQLAGAAFTSAYSTMTDAINTFITTGKGSWAGFAESIIADMAKIALQAAETQGLSAVTSLFSSSGGGGILDAVGGGTRSFAVGGDVAGPGTGTSDSIPAMLSNGEFVMTASATKKYGSLLRSLNSGAGHYATGGAVGSVAPSAAPSVNNGGNTFNLNGGGLTMDDVNALAPHMQLLIDKRMAQKMTGQGGFSYQMRNGMI